MTWRDKFLLAYITRVIEAGSPGVPADIAGLNRAILAAWKAQDFGPSKVSMSEEEVREWLKKYPMPLF